MNPEDAVDLGREALKVCMMVGGPIIIVGLIVGLVIGILQAMTQVQDQTVSFVPKILIMIIGIGVALPWLSERMVDYTRGALEKPILHLGGSSTPYHSHPFGEPVAAPIKDESDSAPPVDDRVAGGRFSDRMPTLRQKYSIPTMKPPRSSSMPRLESAIQSPRVAEKQEVDF